MSKYTIKELPEEYRPREKLLTKGMDVMSDQELIGILLRTGNQGVTAVQLGEKLLYKFSDLRSLSACHPIELMDITGIGVAKATQITAAFELGRRVSLKQKNGKTKISNPSEVHTFLLPQMRILDKEHFVAVLLNTKNCVIKVSQISVGTLNSSIVHPRELFKVAIKNSSNSVIIAHNHPSGDVNPSREDISLTKRLCDAGSLIGIKVLDHIILGSDDFFSFKDNNLM